MGIGAKLHRTCGHGTYVEEPPVDTKILPDAQEVLNGRGDQVKRIISNSWGYVCQPDYRSVRLGHLIWEHGGQSGGLGRQEAAAFRWLHYVRYRIAELRRRDIDGDDASMLNCLLKWHDQALGAICECNRGLAMSIAGAHVPYGHSVDDLGAAQLALVESALHFDYSTGFRFVTYAYYTIQRRIYRSRIEPTPTLPPEKLLISRQRRPDDTDACMAALAAELVQTDAITDRERTVLGYRYGLNGGPSLTLCETAQILRVSKERVRQIQLEALEKLRGCMGG